MNDKSPFSEPHVVLPTSIHTHTIILLHGRGGNGKEFADELFEGETFSEQSLPQHFPGFKWVFPNAKSSFSTVFNEDLAQWFDIYSLTDPNSKEELQIDGLRESAAFVHRLIDEEVQVFGPFAGDRIILGGISQGCAVGITTLLSGACGIGAFVGFNGWMPLLSRVKGVISLPPSDHTALNERKCNRLTAALRKSLSITEGRESYLVDRGRENVLADWEDEHIHTPIFLSHSKDDNIVDIALGREMRRTLIALGTHRVVWKGEGEGDNFQPSTRKRHSNSGRMLKSCTLTELSTCKTRSFRHNMECWIYKNVEISQTRQQRFEVRHQPQIRPMLENENAKRGSMQLTDCGSIGLQVTQSVLINNNKYSVAIGARYFVVFAVNNLGPMRREAARKHP